jgi:hypothetical protein
MKKLANVLITCAAATLGWTALAQSDVTSTVSAERNPPLRRNTFEIRPIETLMSVTPGIASGGASFESYIGRNFAVTVGASYADVDLPQKFVGTINDEKNAPTVNKGYGYSVGTGLRYYDSPIGDSLYGALDVAYSEARNGWKYNDETYRTTRIAVTPSVSAGYRWVWQNGALLRLGAGVGLPSVQSQSVVTETNGVDAAEGEDKINDLLDTKALAMLDLGLGVMF